MRINASGTIKAVDEIAMERVLRFGKENGLELESFGDNEIEICQGEYFLGDFEEFVLEAGKYLVAGEICCDDRGDENWKYRLNPDTHKFTEEQGYKIFLNTNEIEDLKTLAASGCEAFRKLVAQL